MKAIEILNQHKLRVTNTRLLVLNFLMAQQNKNAALRWHWGGIFVKPLMAGIICVNGLSKFYHFSIILNMMVNQPTYLFK